MPGLTQPSAAVNQAGLIQLGVYAGQSGQIDDGSPADALPDTHSRINRSEIFGVIHKIGSSSAQRFNQIVDYAVGWRKHRNQDGNDNHCGNKMRQIGDGLSDFLERAILKLVEQQRQDDRRREAPDKAVKTNQEGIADEPPKIGRLEKVVKCLKPPFTGPNTSETHCNP